MFSILLCAIFSGKNIEPFIGICKRLKKPIMSVGKKVIQLSYEPESWCMTSFTRIFIEYSVSITKLENFDCFRKLKLEL